MANREERPWGFFEILFQEENLKVKRISVKPDKRLSLQSHSSRSENWVILQGKALVELDGTDNFLSENQSIYIKKNSRHRIKNIGKNDVIFVEVQTGDYLGEDDIIRYEDDFNRV